ncbi:hypothetical protein SAMN05660750_03293 [Bosea thiooxidans]|uniref:Uncharacterized protein n=1 Tax=Bosea thiooxidans TaxID=53254 RepID=A0A1T5FK47_9HYPH|nr:hypothetical protein SAMN05660750_03293 [Bosea thiooxidans]
MGERRTKRTVPETGLTSSPGFSLGIFGERKLPSSSHFAGGLMPFLHAHRRRVPAQNIDRSVMVGMGAESAMLTDKGRLAFAALTLHGSAFRTCLRGEGGGDLQKASPAFVELVGEDGFETEPTLVKDGAVEPAFLPNHAARLLDRSSCRGGHIADVQVFENYAAEAPADVECGLVLPVATDAGAAGGQSRATLKLPKSARRSFLSTRQCALSNTLSPLDSLEACRDGHPFTGRERERVRYAAVDADGRASIGRGKVLNFAGEAGVPAECVERDGNVFDRAAQRARVAEFHPADLGQPNSRPFGTDLLDLDFPPLKTERVIDALLPRGRIARTAPKEIAEGLVEVTQGLLLAGLCDGGDPVVFSAEPCQLSALGCIIEMPPSLAVVLPPPVATLLKGEIVDQSADASELAEQSLLFGAGRQLVAEATIDHSPILASLSESSTWRRATTYPHQEVGHV